MQPHRVVERHAIYKPTRPRVQLAVQVGGSQAVQSTQKQALQKQLSKDMFYVTLVQRFGDNESLVGDDAKGEEVLLGGNEKSEERKGINANDGSWSIKMTDVPEPAKRPVTLRSVSVTDVLEGDVHAHMLALGYRYGFSITLPFSRQSRRSDFDGLISFVDEYILDGHRLIYNNVIFLLHRLLKFPALDATNPNNQAGTQNGQSNDGAKTLSPRKKIPPLNYLQPFDPSGTYVLQASIRVMDGAKPELVTAATKELIAVQAELKGVVGLRVVDRLALDTRIK